MYDIIVSSVYENSSLVKLYGHFSIMYTRMGISIFRDCDFKELGARVVNTLFMHLGIPLAVLPKYNGSGGPADVKSCETFYLVTECGQVIVQSKFGFSVSICDSGGYRVITASAQKQCTTVNNEGYITDCIQDAEGALFF